MLKTSAKMVRIPDFATAFNARGYVFCLDAPAGQPVTAAAEAMLAGLVDDLSSPPGAASTYAIYAMSGDDLWAVRCGGEDVVTHVSPAGALDFVMWHINQRVIDTRARESSLLHAAAVVHDGEAMLLAAPMNHGKTTTTLGLLQAGWSYLTDEAVELTEDGLALPFPKALSLDPGSWPLFPTLAPADPLRGTKKWHVPPESIRPGIIAAPARVRMVVCNTFAAGSTTTVRPLTPAEALVRLATSTFMFDQTAPTRLRELADLCRAVPAFEVTIGDLASGVDVLQRTFDEAV